jgi:NAD(P)-dependent dehydrogenase (short-subunit alcohol dehydrogenase family)
MSFSPSDLPDLTGSIAVVTGASSGIGLHTAKHLAAHGASVVLAVRDTGSGEKAAASMRGADSSRSVRVEHLDLASQASVRSFAERWEGPLDLLVNNAGVMRPPVYRETEDGHELMFGTNHLGHFALTGRLLPALQLSATPRVVTVASIAHLGGTRAVLEANPRSSYSPEGSYCQSKLANVMFMRELGRRATSAGSSLVSTGAHPGVSATGLVSDPNGMGANPVVRVVAPVFMPLIFQSAAAGANPSLYAATLGDPGSYTGPQRRGESRGPIGPARFNKVALDDDLTAKLWELSVEKTGVEFSF